MWSECTKDCGGGIQYRTRWCVDPHPRGKGKECSEQKELGPAMKSRSCNKHDCIEGTKHSPSNTSPLKAHYSNEPTQVIYGTYKEILHPFFLYQDLQSFKHDKLQAICNDFAHHEKFSNSFFKGHQ